MCALSIICQVSQSRGRATRHTAHPRPFPARTSIAQSSVLPPVAALLVATSAAALSHAVPLRSPCSRSDARHASSFGKLATSIGPACFICNAPAQLRTVSLRDVLPWLCGAR